MTLARRGFLTGLVGLIASPAIVRVSSLMAIKAVPLYIPLPLQYTLDEYSERILGPMIARFVQVTEYDIMVQSQALTDYNFMSGVEW